MITQQIVLLFTETTRRWSDSSTSPEYAGLIAQLKRRSYTVHLNNYTLAFHNRHYPVVLIGGAKFLKAYSLPNPSIVVPQELDAPGQIDFLYTDYNVQTVLLPAHQIDYFQDERVRVGNLYSPDFVETLLDVLVGRSLILSN